MALLGVVAAVALMFVQIDTDFSDDPLLRLQGFGRQAGPAPTTARCGSPLSNLQTPSGGGTLYEVARDRACHEASKRRAAIAFAAGTLLVVLGVAGVVRADQRDPLGAGQPAPRNRRADERDPVNGGRDGPAPEQQTGDDAGGASLESDELADAVLADGGEDTHSAGGGGGVADYQ